MEVLITLEDSRDIWCFTWSRNPCFSGSSNHTGYVEFVQDGDSRVAILVLVEVLITLTLIIVLKAE